MAAGPLALLALGGGLIGVLLPLLGAGGSILLLPLLVSGVHLPSRQAVPLALLVVMLLALANLLPSLRRGQIALQPALSLGLPALVGSWIGGRWVKAGLVSEPLQLALFAAAALVAAWLLLRPHQRPPTTPGRGPAATGGPTPGRPVARARPTPLTLPVQGLMVGLLTGISGVGGGFAIVPALVLLAGLPMQQASSTSLLLIPLNALVALMALGKWPGEQLPLLLPLLVGGALGTVVGRRLQPHLSERRLRQGFAGLLLGSALLVAAEALHRPHGAPGVGRERRAPPVAPTPLQAAPAPGAPSA